MTKVLAFLFLVFVLCSAPDVCAQTTEFTFQGSLKNGAAPANGNYDIEFKLFDAISGGAQQGSTLLVSNVSVANGIFTVSLDFGAINFPGAPRFIEIGLRVAGNPGGFQQLLPRIPLASAPYAIRSLNAANADSVAVAGLPAGNGNYIQNQNSGAQASSNFNISGSGTASAFEAVVVNAGQYNILGNRILSSPTGTFNLFAGTFTGLSITTGQQNSFFGSGAGQNTTSGGNNSFFGTSAGVNNTTGSNNAFFGSGAGVANTGASFNAFFGTSAGQSNSAGNDNAFFGAFAGQSNSGGNNNSFFGRNAGVGNTSGSDNSFFGRDAGLGTTSGAGNSFFGYSSGTLNTIGINNSFFGTGAGTSNTDGSGNAFFGTSAGNANTTGSANSIFGVGANVLSPGLTNAGAFGRWAAVSSSNTIVLGSIIGINSAPVNTRVGIGVTSPVANLHVQNGGTNAGRIHVGGTQTGGEEKIITFGDSLCLGEPCVFIGERTADDVMELQAATFNFLAGRIKINTLGPAGATTLCRNASNEVSTCSSSLRYKTNVSQFSNGLSFVNRLRPIAFDWKDGGMKDVGFGAEDIAKIDPRFVTYNDKGEVEGVKYDRLSAVLVNALKEQQTQIEKLETVNAEQQKQNAALRMQVDELKAVVCSIKEDADICKTKGK